MRATLIINNKDFGPYIPEGGIKSTKETRNVRTVTTLNGEIHRFGVAKRKLAVQLFPMGDRDFSELSPFLQDDFTPVHVIYADIEQGRHVEGSFFMTDIAYTAQKTMGTISYWTDISFTLTEQ